MLGVLSKKLFCVEITDSAKLRKFYCWMFLHWT